MSIEAEDLLFFLHLKTSTVGFTTRPQNLMVHNPWKSKLNTSPPKFLTTTFFSSFNLLHCSVLTNVKSLSEFLHRSSISRLLHPHHSRYCTVLRKLISPKQVYRPPHSVSSPLSPLYCISVLRILSCSSEFFFAVTLTFVYSSHSNFTFSFICPFLPFPFHAHIDPRFFLLVFWTVVMFCTSTYSRFSLH